jgi:mono/diheme cytochrome c family protein
VFATRVRRWARPRLALLATWLALGAAALPRSDPASGDADFDRDIRPLLADRCFVCHGPDAAQRQAELRLDSIDEAIAAGVLEPGDPEASELVRRIESPSARKRMPPADSRLALSDDERALLRRWVAEGARHEPHWAFRPLPAEVATPAVRDGDWPREPLDRFVLAELEAQGLAPAPEADRRRWLRRASFDLTGLPPTPEELAAFEADARPDAYERVVDRLLAAPAYAERMALPWLDVARYADSYGYQSDLLSPTWPWRDWVVRAFAENLPYDRFLTWQLAGDLLEEPTRDQRLATAFQRLHRMTNEGGSIAEEWRAEGVADRVQTFGTALLGLTLECARCHDHKFDPLSQREYYGLSSYFDSIDEWGLYNDSSRVPTPALLLPTPEQEQRARELGSAVDAASRALELARASAPARAAVWIADPPTLTAPTGATGRYPLDAIGAEGALANLARPERPGRTAPGNAITQGRFGGALGFSGDDAAVFPEVAGGLRATQPVTLSFWLRLPEQGGDAVVLHNSGGTDAGYHGFELAFRDGRLRMAIVRHWPGNALAVESEVVPRGRWVHVAALYDGHLGARGMHVVVDGADGTRVVRERLTKDPGQGGDGFSAGERFRDFGLRGGALDELTVFERVLAPLELRELHSPGALAEAFAAGDRPALEGLYLAACDAPLAAADAELRAARAALQAERTGWLEVPVMEDLPQPRAAHLLERGAYDAPRDDSTRVRRGTPAVLPPPAADLPLDRLGLARWLTHPEHPLTARVAVNRFWESFFGRGLVETVENFGAQGAPPSHPELLDRLARDFVDSGWDVARLCRGIVLSATYRLDSRARPELLARDPGNVLLARGPAQRLSAEMLRDAALFAAGLLDPARGGPPVSPYQPGELWTESNSMSPAYVQSVGGDLYRRSLYTVRKRTAPMPNMSAFDAPSREQACARRSQTNTPLQALVLLDDVQFVEAARVLAERTLREVDDPDGHIARIFERLTARLPEPAELAVLRRLLAEERAAFLAEPGRALALASVGERPRAAELEPVDVAALTVVAQAVLNLDACVWKR